MPVTLHFDGAGWTGGTGYQKFYREFFCKLCRDFFNKIEGDFNLKGFLNKMDRDVEFWSDSFLKGFFCKIEGDFIFLVKIEKMPY